MCQGLCPAYAQMFVQLQVRYRRALARKATILVHAHVNTYSQQPEHKPKQFLKKKFALVFLKINMGEESSQPTKHANKIIRYIF